MKNYHNDDTRVFAQMLNMLGFSAERVNITHNNAVIDIVYVLQDVHAGQYVMDVNGRPIFHHEPEEVAETLKYRIGMQFTSKLIRSLTSAGYSDELWQFSQDFAVTYYTLSLVSENFRCLYRHSPDEKVRRKDFYNKHRFDFEVFDMLANGCCHVDLASIGDSDMVKNISALDLSTRVTNALYRIGIATVGQLTNTTERELRSIRNLGDACIKEIRDALDAVNLTLRDE